MKIFFDVDYTILGLDDTLRPNTKETFQRLLDDGHEIHIWSGMGAVSYTHLTLPTSDLV